MSFWPRFSKPAPIKAITPVALDAYKSTLTALGVPTRDRATAVSFDFSPELTAVDLDALYRDNWIAKKVVSGLVALALAKGFDVVFPSADPELASKLQVSLKSELKRLNLKFHLRRHLRQSLQYGGSILAIGVNDAAVNLAEPLPDGYAVTNFAAYERFDLSEWDDGRAYVHTVYPEQDTRHAANPRHGEPNGYTVLSTGARLHYSRYHRTTQDRITERTTGRTTRGTFGPSVLQPMWDAIKDFGASMQGAAHLAQDPETAVYGVKNLASILTAQGPSAIETRFQNFEAGRSVFNAVLKDADGESFERKALTVSGFDALIDRLMINVAAAVDRPVTVLFGVSPGGFGTGESELRQWYDKVETYQEETVGPAVEAAVRAILGAQSFPGGPTSEPFEVTFPPIRAPSQSEVMTARQQQAVIDQAYFAMGALAPDEIRKSRFGAEYSHETQIEADVDLSDDVEIE